MASNFIQIKVESKEAGVSIVSFLRKHVSHLSGKKIKRMIDEEKCCCVNGKLAFFSSYKVRAGDAVSFKMESIPIQIPKTLPILYEDEDLLAINKPAHVISDEVFLKTLLRKKNLFLVHRLDKETTGILLLAKNRTSKSFLEREFRRRKVEKEYLALVEGEMKKKKGTIENFLGSICSFEGGSLWGEVLKEKGFYAKTKWTCLSQGKQHSLLLCEPLTGRTHQIRVHLKSIGHPIVGDVIYGNPVRKWPHHFLHAHAIKFMHPTKKEVVSFTAPLSIEMQKICPPFSL